MCIVDCAFLILKLFTLCILAVNHFFLFQLNSHIMLGKVTLLQAQLWPRGGGRGISLPFQDLGARRGWVVISTPQPHFTCRKDLVPIVQEAGWAPGLVWMGGKSCPHRDYILHTCITALAWRHPTTSPTTFHIWKTRGCQCRFRLLMMGGVSPETCWASYKYGIIKILIHCCILLDFSL
jgi:hypothetical protein